jgi:hypothetical protein
MLLAGGLTGALLLLIAEFTTLYTVRVAASPVPIRTVSTGSHHAYGLVPIALLAAFLAVGVWREGSRPALLALGILGVVTLLIALLGDLPDAHATGLIGTSGNHYAVAAARPGIGFYLETLGAVILIITCTSGFILLGAPQPGTATRAPQANGARG